MVSHQGVSHGVLGVYAAFFHLACAMLNLRQALK